MMISLWETRLTSGRSAPVGKGTVGLSPIFLRMINGIRAKQANGQGDRRMNEKKAMRGERMELIDKQGRIQAVLSAEYGMPYIVRYDGKGRILS